MQRIDYAKAAPDLYKALTSVDAALNRSPLDKKLLNLVYLRVSQINGCSFCVDLHSRALHNLGETQERLDGLAAWRESPYFTEAEKTALAWAESLTDIGRTHAPEDAYDAVCRHYSDADVVSITFAAAEMNAWNRIAIGTRQAPVARHVAAKGVAA